MPLRHLVPVELTSHDLLIAEGAAAESYLDTGNRGAFANGGEPMALHPVFTDGQTGRAGRSCAPFLDDPADVEPIWRRVAARAAASGFASPVPVALVSDPALLIASGGREFQPVHVATGRSIFALPMLHGPIRLVSRATAPSTLRPWVSDRRTLGVAVFRIVVHRGPETEVIPPDHPVMTDGWWEAERNDATVWRWTNGDALLPVDGGEPLLLEVEFVTPDGYPAADCGDRARIARQRREVRVELPRVKAA